MTSFGTSVTSHCLGVEEVAGPSAHNRRADLSEGNGGPLLRGTPTCNPPVETEVLALEDSGQALPWPCAATDDILVGNGFGAKSGRSPGR